MIQEMENMNTQVVEDLDTTIEVLNKIDGNASKSVIFKLVKRFTRLYIFRLK